MEVQDTKQFQDGISRMGGSSRVEVQDEKQFECGISRMKVPGWKFRM